MAEAGADAAAPPSPEPEPETAAIDGGASLAPSDEDKVEGASDGGTGELAPPPTDSLGRDAVAEQEAEPGRAGRGEGSADVAGRDAGQGAAAGDATTSQPETTPASSDDDDGQSEDDPLGPARDDAPALDALASEFDLDALFPAAHAAELRPERQPTDRRAPDEGEAAPSGEDEVKHATGMASFAGTDFRPAARRRDALAHKGLHRSVEAANERLVRCGREFDVARGRLHKAQLDLADLEVDAEGKVAEHARLRAEGAASGRLAAARRSVDAARLAHARFLNGEHASAAEAEADAHEQLRDAELDAMAAASLEAELTERDARDADADAAYATAALEAEARAVAARAARRAKARDEAQRALERREEDERMAVAAARAARKRAVARVRASNAAAAASRAKFDEQCEERARRRAEVLLDLKASTEAAAERVRARAAAAAQRHEREREAHEREFQDLLADGQNPYVVFRRKEVAREDAAAARRAARAQERRMGSVRSRVARDEELYSREIERTRVEAEHQARYQATLGPHVRDAENERYMAQNTLSGDTILEPDGKAKPFPSHVMAARTSDFGLGRADDATIDRVHARHPDAAPNALLLSRPPRDYARLDEARAGTARGSPAELEADAERAAVRALGGADGDDGEVADEGVSVADSEPPTGSAAEDELEVYAEPEFEGRWHAETNLGVPNARKARGVQRGRVALDGDPGSETHASRERLHVPPRSKLEERYLAEARARARKNLVEPQAALGKERQAPAFIATPDIILFRDFEVGKVYRQRVTLTNASRGYSAFRLLEIDAAFKDFFAVTYTFPGKVAPGMGCELTVAFEPKLDEDIDTVLPLLSETGRVDVPLVCTKRRCDVSASTNSLDFGGVTLGEVRSRTVRLCNAGVLEAPFTVEIVGGGTDGGTHGADAAAALSFTESGVVGAYGECAVVVTYAPKTEAPLDASLRVSFDGARVGGRASPPPPIDVALSGSGAPVAVTVDAGLVDFKTCVHGRLYRSEVAVRNASNCALRCRVMPHPALAGFVEFLPRMAFCQPKEKFVFRVKLSPRPEMLDAARRHGLLVEGAADAPVVEAPVRIAVHGQALPCDVVLRAALTTADLRFDPPRLSLGRVAVGERAAAPLRITNASALPQRFGFVGLPPGARVEGGDGGAFGVLLPHETVTRTVSYAPPRAGDARLSLPCRTLPHGNTHRVSLSATGVTPALSLSHNVVRLPATPRGDVSSASVYVANRTDVAQAFELDVPEGSGLVLCPAVATVAPGCRQRVQIDHVPSPAGVGADATEGAGAGEVAASDGVAGDGADVGADGEAASVNSDGGEVASVNGDGEAASVVADGEAASVNGEAVRFDVDAEVVDAEAAVDAGDSLCERGAWTVVLHIQPRADDPAGGGADVPLHLEVHTCAIEREVEVEGAAEVPGAADAASYYRVDFGKVPVGGAALRTVHLTNLAEFPAELSELSAADPHGPFARVNALRPLAARGGSHAAKLTFAPGSAGPRAEVFTLLCGRSRVRLQLVGEGVSPALRLEGDALDEVDGAYALDLGDVGARRGATGPDAPAERELELVNDSPFDVRFEMRTLGRGDARNADGLAAFYASPARGSLKAGGRLAAKVVFEPDREYEHYADVLEVVAGDGEQAPLRVALRGAGWARGAFVVGGDAPPPGARDPVLAHADGEGVLDADSDAEHEVVLTLPGDLAPGEAAEASLFVGSLPNAPAAATFELGAVTEAAAAAGWSVSAGQDGGLKGSAQPGSRAVIAFAFAPPATAAGGAVGGLAALGIDAWCECRVRCVVSGGGAGARAYALVARAMLRAAANAASAAEGAGTAGSAAEAAPSDGGVAHATE